MAFDFPDDMARERSGKENSRDGQYQYGDQNYCNGGVRKKTEGMLCGREEVSEDHEKERKDHNEYQEVQQP